MRREMTIPHLILFVSLCAARPQESGDISCTEGEKYDPVFLACSPCEEGDDVIHRECQSARNQKSGDTSCPEGEKYDPVFLACSHCEEGDNIIHRECQSARNQKSGDISCPEGEKYDPVFLACSPCEEGDDIIHRECQSGQSLFSGISENLLDFGVPECPDGEKFDPVHLECVPDEKPKDCFDSISEIEQAIFKRQPKQAFSDCDKTRKCSFYKKYGYECAPSWTCHNQSIITDGKGLIDIRQALSDDGCASTSGTLDMSDSKCPGNVQDVCCKHPNFRARQCDKPKFGEKRFERCGRSGGDLTLTGVNEYSAQPGEFPHMCIIYRKVEGANAYVGGASLIAPNKVVTVAHKFFLIHRGAMKDFRNRSTEFYVRCGEHNVKNEEELLPSQESVVEDILIHPQYDAITFHNNLAILKTKNNFVYNEHIGPVCLPRPYENFAGQTDCFSSGWGANEYSSTGFFSDDLKKVQMSIVPSPECQDLLRATERFKKSKGSFNIHSSWVCIGGEPGIDTCNGDGGSPHVCRKGNGDFVQVGAVAFGIDCGKSVPSVYSSIPDAMCWVDWVMSCTPMSLENLDFTVPAEVVKGGKDKDLFDFDIFDPRQAGDTSVDSINGLLSTDCQKWAEQNFELTDQCKVIYGAVDERGGT